MTPEERRAIIDRMAARYAENGPMAAQALAEQNNALDRIAAATERIAAALDRLAPIVPVPEPAPCIRCSGQGWLGHPTKSCHACEGAGQVAG